MAAKAEGGNLFAGFSELPLRNTAFCSRLHADLIGMLSTDVRNCVSSRHSVGAPYYDTQGAITNGPHGIKHLEARGLGQRFAILRPNWRSKQPALCCNTQAPGLLDGDTGLSGAWCRIELGSLSSAYRLQHEGFFIYAEPRGLGFVAPNAPGYMAGAQANPATFGIIGWRGRSGQSRR